MTYFDEIKSNLENHINFLKMLMTDGSKDNSQKIKNHFKHSLEIDNSLNSETPEKLKVFIEYLTSEARAIGWSFPENNKEELSEKSFLEMQNKIKNLINGMTLNERLYYFGYLEEFENIPSNHKTDRDRILHKLFLLGQQ